MLVPAVPAVAVPAVAVAVVGTELANFCEFGIAFALPSPCVRATVPSRSRPLTNNHRGQHLVSP